jgi:hypothetical protein
MAASTVCRNRSIVDQLPSTRSMSGGSTPASLAWRAASPLMLPCPRTTCQMTPPAA